MKYKYIFLDLDGTLTDSAEGITNCARYALEKMGIEVSQNDDLKRFIGPPLIVSFAEFYGLSEDDAKRAVEYYRERFSTIGIFENGVYDGVYEFLQKLLDNCRIPVLATSKPRIYADRIAVKYRLRPYLKMISGAELNGVRNNKRDIIEYAIDKLEIKDRSRILMVGDRRHDIEGAAQCGVDSCGVTYGYALPGELEKAGAKYIAHNFDELYKIAIQA